MMNGYAILLHSRFRVGVWILEQAGYKIAALLYRLMNGEKIRGQTITIEPSFIVNRQSTDLYHLDAPDIPKALMFIKNNFMKPYPNR